MELSHAEDNSTDSEYVPDKEDAEDDSDTNSKSGKKSNSTESNEILSYFDTNVDNPELVNCKLCKKEVSFNGLADLELHFAKYHRKVEFGSSGGDSVYTKKSKGLISKAWIHFDVKNAEKKIAKCKYCGKKISYRFITNLTKHILRMHIKPENRDEGNDSSESTDDEKAQLKSKPRTPPSQKSSRRSKAWKFFEPTNPMNKIATCKICFKDLSYLSSLTNLTKHIKKMHPDSMELLSDEIQVIKSESKSSKTRKPQKRFQSSTWKYFDNLNKDTNMTRCKLCGKDFSYTCITNLAKHIKRIHSDVLDGSTSSDVEYEEVVTEEGNDSPVWAYFKCLDETLKIASCLICKKRVDYNDADDLHRHMKKKHPGVDLAIKNKPKKLMITENGDIYEIDDSVAKQETVDDAENSNASDDWANHTEEVDALHAEYLDEEANEELSSPPKRLKPSFKSRKERVFSTPRTDDDVTSLDMFGKYLVTLLKKLPKHKSDYLQMEFIRQAMEEENDSNINCSVQKSRNNRKSVKKTRPVIDNGDQRVINNTVKINDDTLVSSNSDVRKIITTDGVIQNLETNNEEMVTSACYSITVTNNE